MMDRAIWEGAYTDGTLRVHRESFADRWHCRVVLPESARVTVEPEDGVPVGRIMSSAVLPDGKRRIALGYLPQDFCEEGRQLEIEYFNQKFPVEVAAVLVVLLDQLGQLEGPRQPGGAGPHEQDVHGHRLLRRGLAS